MKPVFAVARADQVELHVNGRSLGLGQRSLDTLFTWISVVFAPGEIKVVASRSITAWCAGQSNFEDHRPSIVTHFCNLFEAAASDRSGPKAQKCGLKVANVLALSCGCCSNGSA